MNMSGTGRVAVIGAGPGGMAAALGLRQAGFEVALFERDQEVKPQGNILNLWPPPLRVLELLGVDTAGIGAPCRLEYARNDGKVRAVTRMPEEFDADKGGGFVGLLRWGLYQRMLAALPDGILHLDHEMTSLEQTQGGVTVNFAGHPSAEFDVVLGADGLNSGVRRSLWGDGPIRHQKLHVVAGWLLSDDPPPSTAGVIGHDRTTQASYTALLYEGKPGWEWWVLEAFDPDVPFTESNHEFASKRVVRFPEPLPSLVARTPTENLQRWVIRDRKPMKQWSKGRVTLCGDAAHPTSPYAAYGAGMSIEDGYFLAAELEKIDVRDAGAVSTALQAYEDRRKTHTRRVTQQAYMTGRVFHHTPRFLAPVRDFIFDHTPLLQKVIGDATPSHILAQMEEIESVEAGRPARAGRAHPESSAQRS
jgi:6-hydroxynicotinate 3-monooxygenase